MQTLPSARYTGKGELKYSALREAALEYAAQGLRVLSVHTPALGGCRYLMSDCDSVGKHPRAHNGPNGTSLHEVVRLLVGAK
jgi:hypothetical protein